ncbi:MAG: hypothetical protein JXQ23_03935, partial [Clostridia bacterium]|nr:hypothetical protein [Clostridia bacterium]
AWVGIADSYYNLSNFAKAAEVYRKILGMNIDERILRNSLNALEWSCDQTEQYDFIEEANNLARNQNNADFKRIILVQKADYEFRMGRWDESINSLTEVKTLTADHGLILDMELKIAQALVNLEQYDQAEKIYQRLGVEKKDPETFIYWAQMKLRQKNEMEAAEKMRQAALLTSNNDIWLQLLELSVNSGHPQFLDDYHKFLEFGSEDNIARAKIFWLKWKIERQQFAETDLVLKNLLAGKDKWVKANAQYLSGLSLYKQDKYSESIPELLRVRYLYPDLVEVRSEAETVACLAYLKAGNKEEAEKLFKSIEEEITPDQRKLISDAIGEAGN